PQWRLSLPPESIEAARDLAARISRAVEPLVSVLVRIADGRVLTDKLPLGDWAARTGRTLEAVCADERGDLSALWSNEAGETLATQLGELMAADGLIEADGPQWIDIFAALTASQAVKPKAMRHPRVF